LWKLWTGSPAAGAWLGIALSNGIALSLAYVTEFRHKQLARWLKAKVDPAVLLPSN